MNIKEMIIEEPLILIGIAVIIQIITYTILEIVDIYQERKNKNEDNKY